MIFLSLDTSTKYSVIAISSENGFEAGARHLFEKRRSDGISRLIDASLKKAKIQIGDVDYFAAGIGPGSFTGLRIGLGTLKGLSYALAKPCLAFSSLDAIALNDTGCKKQQLCVIVDARRSNVYAATYKLKTKVSEDRLLSLPVLLKNIRRDAAFCGDAVHLYKKDIEAKVKDCQFIAEEFWYPTPESVSLATQEAFRSGKSFDSFSLAVQYLYEDDCQVRPGLNR
jgi:tRNA threonylcarbamoyl adenosine modification protein YeaZ